MIFGNLGNMGEMMKMAQEMKGKMKDIKQELARANFVGQSKGVAVEVNGEMEIKSVKIDPQIVDPNNVSRLEKEVMEAAKKALKSAKDEAAQKMKGLTGGLGLPGMF